jgi:hypothetical protein
LVKLHTLRLWIHRNSNLIFPLLALAIPLIVRAIPEILMSPYMTGFDTLGYYVPNTLKQVNNGVNFWAFMGDAPLLYMMLVSVTSTGASIVVFLKVLAPLLLGVLGLTVYFYARKTLYWSNWKSLLVVVFATLYFVALRISWDMLRSEIGLIFLFCALILLECKPTRRNGILLLTFMAVVVLAHQLIAVIMGFIIFATLLRFYVDKKKVALRRLLVFSVIIGCLFLFTIYAASYGMNISLISSIPSQSAGEDYALLGFTSYNDLLVNTASFLVFCFLPLLPLLIIGVRYFKSNIQLKAWIIWILISILLTIVSPNASFSVYPYRWIMLLTYPLAFYAVDAFSHMRRNLYKIAAGLCMGLILATLSIGFIALPNNSSLSYFGNFTAYMPKSMLQNTVQLSDCQDTNNALVWTKNNLPGNGCLLVHDVFNGWASLKLDSNQLYHYAFYDPETTAQNLQKINSSTALYLIWWVNGTGWYGKLNVPSSFNEVYHSGNIAIYQYKP